MVGESFPEENNTVCINEIVFRWLKVYIFEKKIGAEQNGANHNAPQM